MAAANLILKVTPEEVRTKASEINTQKTVMTTYLSDMQGKINQLQSAWDSPSGQEFYTKFTNLSKVIQNALDDLTQHVQNLNDAAAEYEAGEQQQQKLVENLSTDNIF